MSELGHAGSFLAEKTKQLVTQAVRLYATALDTSYPDLKLSYEDQSKKEVELLIEVATDLSLMHGISYVDLVSKFILASVAAYKVEQDDNH